MIDKDFEVVSVEPSDAPRDTVGTGWHCYVIGQGNNRIRGYKRGDCLAVTQAAEEIVERLNERRYGRGGRVSLTMTPRPRSPGKGQ